MKTEVKGCVCFEYKMAISCKSNKMDIDISFFDRI